MINSVVKISSILFLLISILILFISIFVKFFYIDEEILNVPVVESDNKKIKTEPKPAKENDKDLSFEIEILNETNNDKEQQKLIFNENKPELIPFEVIDKNNKKKINDDLKDKSLNQGVKNNEKENKKTTKKNLDKYRVQLGSFKSKNRAIKAMKNIQSTYAKYFQNIKLEIYSFKKDNYIIHRVWTNLMKKKMGLNLCNELKKKKVNCILQVEKN